MNAIRPRKAKCADGRDVPGNKTRLGYPCRSRDLLVGAPENTKPVSFNKDRKTPGPGRSILKSAAVERGLQTTKEEHVQRSCRNGEAEHKSQFQECPEKTGEDAWAGAIVQHPKQQSHNLAASTTEILDNRPLGNDESSNITTRRITRRVRRQRSEQTLEAFSEISGDDLTVESSMACVYSQTEDVVIEEEIDYGYGTNQCVAPIPSMVQLEPKLQNQGEAVKKQSKVGRRQSIGTVSISVNIAPPTDTTHGSRRSRRASISTITVNVNLDQGAGSAQIVNTQQHDTIPTTDLTNINNSIQVASGKRNSAITSVVVVPTNGKQSEESGGSESEADYSVSESFGEEGVSPEQLNADSLEALVANISVQLTSDENSVSSGVDKDNENGNHADESQQGLLGVHVPIPPLKSIPQSAARQASACTEITPVSAKPSEITTSRRTTSLLSHTKPDKDRSNFLTDMSRDRLVDLVRSNGQPDVQVHKSTARARTTFKEGSVRHVDPLGDSTHSYKAETTETVEAYETAVSMQNIGIHNRYGFMIDDKEVKRSSSRRRASLSFNRPPSDSQEPSHTQMRNHCEPMAKRNTENRHHPPAPRLLPLSNQGSTRSAGVTGPGRYGQMQKSMSTRSFSKRSQFYRRASSRSINQSQTIAENVEMVDQTPYVQQASFGSKTDAEADKELISNMTIMYQRRSSKSLFKNDGEDDDLSVSDMGSVMSFDRDDGSVAGFSVGASSVISSRTKESQKSTGLSVGHSSRKSRGFRMGKLIKKISLRRKGSEESSHHTRKSSRSSNFFHKMLAKRGSSKKELEPWRALDTTSPCYWADVDPSLTSFKPAAVTTTTTPVAQLEGHPVAQPEGRRIKRRASM